MSSTANQDQIAGDKTAKNRNPFLSRQTQMLAYQSCRRSSIDTFVKSAYQFEVRAVADATVHRHGVEAAVCLANENAPFLPADRLEKLHVGFKQIALPDRSRRFHRAVDVAFRSGVRTLESLT